MTGSLIPFRQLGFSSLLELLESQPDKFKLTTYIHFYKLNEEYLP